jgi:hypothetical protein
VVFFGIFDFLSMLRRNPTMARRIAFTLVLAIFLGCLSGCGKEQPSPPKGVNPFDKTKEDPQGKPKRKNPMMPD